MSEIRPLRLSDLPAAIRLSQAAGWNQLPADWERLLRIEPGGCFALEAGGEVAATTTAVCFGDRLAWIGMVLTHPDHRRRGYARLLMERALEFCASRRIEWIKLDATDMGAPLYRKLGFEDEGLVERWAGAGLLKSPASGPVHATLDRQLDLAAFGVDRGAVLRSLAVECAGEPGGFVMGRPGANAHSVGPCVCREPETARRLLEWFLHRHPSDTVYWDLLPDNAEAVRLAESFGFKRRRRLIRMVRAGVPGSPPLAFDNELVYATAGFEYG